MNARGGLQKIRGWGQKVTDLPPHRLAAADQELAAITAVVDELVEQWRVSQAHYDGLNLDRLARLMRFMQSDVGPALGWMALLPAVAVAVEKLAGDRQ